jgi:hypothetical protein
MTNKYLEKISVKYEDEINKKQQLKIKIENRFMKKPKGIIFIKIGKFTKLSIEYMFGAKYCIKRLQKEQETMLSVLCDINKLVEIIFKEKGRRAVK